MLFECWNFNKPVKMSVQVGTTSKLAKVESDNQKPVWSALASPESRPCCSVQVCRQVSSPVSLWSSGRGSLMWWFYLTRRWMFPHSSRCNSEYAGICHTLYAPGERQNVKIEGLKSHIVEKSNCPV